MESCWSILCCRTPFSKQVAKHAAFLIIPQVIFGGALAGVTNAHPSSFDGELEKYTCMTIIAFLMGCHVAFALYYYAKRFERYRVRDPIYFVEYEPVRNMPEEHRLFVNEDNYIDIRQLRESLNAA